MEANPLQAGESFQLHSPTEGKHTEPKENQWLCICCIQRGAWQRSCPTYHKSSNSATATAGDRPTPGLVSDLVFLIGAGCAASKKTGFFTRADSSQERDSSQEYLPLHFQRWDNSSMAAINSCPVHIHSTSPCSLPRKDTKGEISQLQRWVVAIKDTAACSAKKCLGWALWMCRLSFSNARQLYQGISKLVCISVEQKEAILILNS